ncbi:MAG: aspartate kinase [Chloroflexota bacterium]
MKLIVQKYGGSSVADAEKMMNVARRTVKARGRAKNKVVVVVSAMGKTTDQLIELAHRITDAPDAREMDVLLSTGELISSTLLTMALKKLGVEAISLSGAQAGIVTDTKHRRASILRVDPKRIREELDKGKVVIVAGFQGMTDALDVTTLGRGGSDTTAVALAAALKADSCEIYTDVRGVYTADPRLVPEARQLKEIGYEEMLEMAWYGSKVMHSRAVELGWLHGVPILVASSFDDAPGTLICGGASMEAKNKVKGIAHDLNVAKVMVVGVPDRPGIAATLFEPLTEAGISVDTIVQNSSIQKVADLTFTVARSDLAEAMRLVRPVAKKLGAKECLSDATLGKVSIVGTGMQNTPGYASKMFRTLADNKINIELISTSEIRITCIIAEKQVKDAVNALHRAFELEKGEL